MFHKMILCELKIETGVIVNFVRKFITIISWKNTIVFSVNWSWINFESERLSIETLQMIILWLLAFVLSWEKISLKGFKFKIRNAIV